MAGNRIPSVDAAGERFVRVVVWALNRLLRTEYQEIERDEKGEPVTIELSTKPLPTETLEGWFAKSPPSQPHVGKAILALKERHTREDIERVLRLLSSTTSEEASQWAEFLDGAEWPCIAQVIDTQLRKQAEIGAAIGDVLVKEREGFGSPLGWQLEQHFERQMPSTLILFAADKYAKEFRDMFPEMVERATRLRILVPSKEVPEFLRRYLVEASRCYIYGHFLGYPVSVPIGHRGRREAKTNRYGEGN